MVKIVTPAFLSAAGLDKKNYKFNDYEENKSHHTGLGKISQDDKGKDVDVVTEEFEKAYKDKLETLGQQYKNKKIDMREAGIILSLADDLADAKKGRLAGQVYKNVREAVQKSINFSDLRVFDGTEENPEIGELNDKVTPENAQRYYESEDGKKALAEIGAMNVKTDGSRTTAEINGQNCTLEMNENGTLRFSFIQDNGAVHAWEYDLQNKPEVSETPSERHADGNIVKADYSPSELKDFIHSQDIPKEELDNYDELNSKFDSLETEMLTAAVNGADDSVIKDYSDKLAQLRDKINEMQVNYTKVPRNSDLNGVSELGEGLYKLDGERRAEDSLPTSVIDKSAVTLEKDIQLDLLKKAGIDTDNLTANEAKDGTYSFNNGNSHYRVVYHDGDIKIINTNISGQVGKTMVYKVDNPQIGEGTAEEADKPGETGDEDNVPTFGKGRTDTDTSALEQQIKKQQELIKEQSDMIKKLKKQLNENSSGDTRRTELEKEHERLQKEILENEKELIRLNGNYTSYSNGAKSGKGLKDRLDTTKDTLNSGKDMLEAVKDIVETFKSLRDLFK